MVRKTYSFQSSDEEIRLARALFAREGIPLEEAFKAWMKMAASAEQVLQLCEKLKKESEKPPEERHQNLLEETQTEIQGRLIDMMAIAKRVTHLDGTLNAAMVETIKASGLPQDAAAWFYRAMEATRKIAGVT